MSKTATRIAYPREKALAYSCGESGPDLSSLRSAPPYIVPACQPAAPRTSASLLFTSGQTCQYLPLGLARQARRSLLTPPAASQTGRKLARLSLIR